LNTKHFKYKIKNYNDLERNIAEEEAVKVQEQRTTRKQMGK